MIHHVGSRPQHGQAESGAGGVLQHVLHLRSGTKHRSVLWQQGAGGRDPGKMSVPTNPAHLRLHSTSMNHAWSFIVLFSFYLFQL